MKVTSANNIRHLDEAKTPRTVGLALGHHPDRVYRAIRHEELTQLVSFLRSIFGALAAPHVRDKSRARASTSRKGTRDANLRGFVIACLDAGGIDSGELKEHPDRLRKMLRARVALPPPDWPRTPAVLA